MNQIEIPCYRDWSPTETGAEKCQRLSFEEIQRKAAMRTLNRILIFRCDDHQSADSAPTGRLDQCEIPGYRDWSPTETAFRYYRMSSVTAIGFADHSSSRQGRNLRSIITQIVNARCKGAPSPIMPISSTRNPTNINHLINVFHRSF